MYYRLRLTHYFDVWGNEKDGYDVNDARIVWDDIWTHDLDDKTLLKILKNTGFLQKHVRTNQLNFDWPGPDYCEITLRKNYYPLCRIDIIDWKED